MKPFLKDIIDQLQKDTTTSVFIKNYNRLSKDKGIIGEKRLRIFRKAFDALLDFMLPDPFAYALYLTNTNDDPENMSWLSKPLLHKMKK